MCVCVREGEGDAVGMALGYQINTLFDKPAAALVLIYTLLHFPYWFTVGGSIEQCYHSQIYHRI